MKCAGGASGAFAACLLSALVGSALCAPEFTSRHEKGRCAIRGHCGKESLFGSELPCPDNGPAATPDDATRTKLVDICGHDWAETDVCCNEDQLDALAQNLKRVGPIVNACPACKQNFFNLFCTFTCSPDQSTFVNVTETKPKDSKYLVTGLDHLVSTDYASEFYRSCKDVKFDATNGKAMDLIGGGAKNYTEFLTFLGQKRIFGSPFQMNFPRPAMGPFPDMTPMNKFAYSCNATDEAYRCPCVDCAGSCAALPAVTETKHCRVGGLPCFSFAVVLVACVVLVLSVVGYAVGRLYQRHIKRKGDQMPLLSDPQTSGGDVDDEGDSMTYSLAPYPINRFLEKAMQRLGYLCAKFPKWTVFFALLFVGLLSLGWINFQLETNPERLWVPPSSDAAQEKAFFDKNFGPFYRIEQAFLVNETGPVLNLTTLNWWFDAESRVERTKSLQYGNTLNDVCYKPVGDACVVQSVTEYFRSDFSKVDPDKWEKQIRECADNPSSCLPAFQQPLDPSLVFGGWDQSVLDARALVVTWVVSNPPEGSEELLRVKNWEDSLKSLMLALQGEARDRGLRLSFNTEVSLEQELNKSNNTDTKIVVISYIIMLAYVSLTLGSSTLTRQTLVNPANALVHSKITLGFAGILIVLMSASASVGLFSLARVKATLIIVAVIPFLILAVGVDNIFLIVHQFERINISHPGSKIEERAGKALGRIGPSIALSATTQTAIFALACAVGMPAVRNFAGYAAVAVLFNATLQLTLFVAAVALNQQRVEARRIDWFPFISMKNADLASSGGTGFGDTDASTLQRFIRNTYAPALLGRRARICVVAVFLGIFAASLALLPNVKLGLDQRLAIPRDSYMKEYFDDLYEYFETGPPVYFVTREFNATQRENQKQICSRFSTCQEDSLPNILELERKRPEVSYISTPTAKWFDNFFYWLNPDNSECCVDNGRPCFADRDPPWNLTLYGMPEGDEFVSYLNRWLAAPTTEECPLGGAAAYSDAVVVDDEQLTIAASHFRTTHKPLRSQEDFINAYRAGRRIASEISERTKASVFAYSNFYIFFDQYIGIERLASALRALLTTLAITIFVLGSFQTGLVVTASVAMTVITVVGFMTLAGVDLNALTLVNLIISVGMAIEFNLHIARAFTFIGLVVMEESMRAVGVTILEQTDGSSGTFRAWRVRGRFFDRKLVAASVFSGITVTKMLGVVVLAFTSSPIFELYYFRVWIILVVVGALFGLVFLLAALSLFGGKGYAAGDVDGGLEQDLRRRREERPLLHSGDSDDEDE
ncbi:hypothetical protein FRB98_002566 [Tulasnella sp. 332]|nr:hypothetical protein FRB98_002566 [Tulasnella sp. 332]